MKFKLLLLSIIFSFTLVGCVTQDQRVLQGGNQLELRSMQTRSFETNDKNMVTRTAIATLQDLNFVIDKADAELGAVSATKLGGYAVIKITVSIRDKGDNLIAVRANATYNLNPIEDSVTYQDFFTSMEKALFLTANKID